jgi:hypothetical protein
MTFKGYSEPVRLTRASLIGVTARIGKVYGASPLGVRNYLRYHASLGCGDHLMAKVLARCVRERVPEMANVNGNACSDGYYKRLVLPAGERERRELRARKERGEVFEMFTRRQA